MVSRETKPRRASSTTRSGGSKATTVYVSGTRRPAKRATSANVEPMPMGPSPWCRASLTLGSQKRAFEKSAMYANASEGASRERIVVS